MYSENISNFPILFSLLSRALLIVSMIINNEKCRTLQSTSVSCILTWSWHVTLIWCFLFLDKLSLTCRKFFATRSRTSIVSQGAIRYGYYRLSNLPTAISPISSEFEHYLQRTSVRSPESNKLDELCERRDWERRSVEGNTPEIGPIQFSYNL